MLKQDAYFPISLPALTGAHHQLHPPLQGGPGDRGGIPDPPLSLPDGPAVDGVARWPWPPINGAAVQTEVACRRGGGGQLASDVSF